MNTLSALNWNIGNPSRERAESQFEAVLSLGPDIICLTETKASAGCTWLSSSLRAAGYVVHFPRPEPGEYGALLASRIPFSTTGTVGPPGLEARAPTGSLIAGVDLVGIYVPSNASTDEKRARKTRFMEAVRNSLDATDLRPTLLLADLNSVPSTHPPVPFMDLSHARWVDELLAAWTDALARDPGPTWFSWRNEAYRYDYTLVRNLTVLKGERVMKLRGPGLSDHAGTWCTVEYPSPKGDVKKKNAWTF